MLAKEGAIASLDRGWKVFPLSPNAKIPPSGSSWTEYRDNVDVDHDLIETWFEDTPTLNYGIATGDGLLVLDIDKKSGGIESAKALFQSIGGRPSSPMARTPNGGFHLYLKLPDDMTIKNSAGVLADGLDLRGDGGYVVGAGSCIDGNYYSWVDGLSPDDVPVAKIPNDLLNLILNTQDRNKKTHQDLDNHDLIPEGKRHQELTKYAGTLRNKRLDNLSFSASIKAFNLNKMSVPLPDSEVDQVIRDALTWDDGSTPPLSYEEAYASLGLTSVGDWIDLPEPPVKWLVDGVLAAESLTMLVGFPKMGKSVFARQLAYCISTGTPFLGRAIEQGTVLYFALEEHAPSVRQAFRSMGLKRDNENLFIRFGSVKKNFVAALEKVIAELHPSVVFLDTFARLPRKTTPDLNSYFGNTELFDDALYWAHELGVTIVPLFHTTKAGRYVSGQDVHASVMGSTGISASYDNVIYITSDPDGTRVWGVQGRLTPVEDALLGFNRDQHWLTELGTKADITEHENRVAVIEAMSTTEPMTADDIRAEAELAKATVTKILKQLIDEKRVVVTGRGTRGDPKKYTAIPIPDSVLALGTEQSPEYLEEESWQSF